MEPITYKTVLEWADIEAGPLCMDKDYKAARRLLAAAPDLVEALEELITWYAARDSEENLLPNINQNPEIYQAMQALAKAQGDKS